MILRILADVSGSITTFVNTEKLSPRELWTLTHSNSDHSEFKELVATLLNDRHSDLEIEYEVEDITEVDPNPTEPPETKKGT